MILTRVKMCTIGSMWLVDPHESLSRNDTAAADTQGAAPQSVLQLISVEEHWGVPGWSGSQIYDKVKWWKRCVKKVFFAGKLVLCERWGIFRFQPVLEKYQRWEKHGSGVILSNEILIWGSISTANVNLPDVREKLTGAVLVSGRSLGKKVPIFQS